MAPCCLMDLDTLRTKGDSTRARSIVSMLLLALGLLAAACGGSSDGPVGASVSPVPSATAAATASSVRQGGANAPLSGLPAVIDRVKPAVVQVTSEQVQLDRFNQPFSVPAGVGSG